MAADPGAAPPPERPGAAERPCCYDIAIDCEPPPVLYLIGLDGIARPAVR